MRTGLKPIDELSVVFVAGLAIGCQPQREINPLAGSASERGRISISLKSRVARLTTLDGRTFFSSGVNCVNRGDTNAPLESTAYHAALAYESDYDWTIATTHRSRTWDFTTVGGWSDCELLAAGVSLVIACEAKACACVFRFPGVASSVLFPGTSVLGDGLPNNMPG